MRALQLALTVAVTWFILDRVGFGLAELAEVEATAWVPDPLLLGAATLLLLAGYGISAALWGLIVRELGGPRLPAADAVRIFMIANLGRYVPGKVWQIAGLAALAKGKGVPAGIAATAAVLGQGLALVAAAAVGLGALLGGPESYRRWGLVGVGGVGVVALLLAVPVVFRRLAGAWFRLARTQPPAALGARHGLRWLTLYVVNWAVYALSFWILVRSLGQGGALLPVASAFAAAYVLGYAMIFAPAGIGPREGFLILFLTPHLGAAPSGVVAVVSRLWTTLVELVPAGVFWLGWIRRRPTEEGGGASAPAGAEPEAPNDAEGGPVSEGRILVIVPTYNEVDNLPRKAPQILSQDPRIDLLVVDDSSPDGTGQLAADLAVSNPRIHAIRRAAKEGLGAAYRAGFEWGLDRNYQLLFEMDADISHPPEALPQMIEAARHHDVVIGSRYVGGRVTVSNWPMSRLLISYLGSWYARTITRMPVRDATGGFNCWRREVLQAVELSRIKSNGYAFQIELKFRAFRKGFSMREIPILFQERDSGESKMSKRIVREAIWRVWWLKLQDLFGRL